MICDENIIYSRLTEIFRDIFDDEDLHVKPEMAACDVEGWDSLNHIRLILTLSKAFSVSFSAAEINSFQNVGDIVAAIKRHREKI